ncbi:MAG: hypothetical protein R2704_12825 [Microthrixaceae bacterium]
MAIIDRHPRHEVHQHGSGSDREAQQVAPQLSALQPAEEATVAQHAAEPVDRPVDDLPVELGQAVEEAAPGPGDEGGDAVVVVPGRPEELRLDPSGIGLALEYTPKPPACRSGR